MLLQIQGWFFPGLLHYLSIETQYLARVRLPVLNAFYPLYATGQFVLVNLSVDFSSTVSADEVESVVQRLDRELKTAIPEIKRVFIEAEARRPSGPAAG